MTIPKSLHHPHLISAAPDDLGRVQFRFRPFTGLEPRPKDPTSLREALSYEESRLIFDEYRVAGNLWEQARFRREIPPLLEAAAPAWKNWERARKAMDAAWEALRDAEDSRWRSCVLRLAEAGDEALRAAQSWDNAARNLMLLEAGHWDCTSEYARLDVREIARETGSDISGWHLSYHDEYERGASPLARETEALIAEREKRLRQVGEMAGGRES